MDQFKAQQLADQLDEKIISNIRVITTILGKSNPQLEKFLANNLKSFLKRHEHFSNELEKLLSVASDDVRDRYKETLTLLYQNRKVFKDQQQANEERISTINEEILQHKKTKVKLATSYKQLKDQLSAIQTEYTSELEKGGSANRLKLKAMESDFLALKKEIRGNEKQFNKLENIIKELNKESAGIPESQRRLSESISETNKEIQTSTGELRKHNIRSIFSFGSIRRHWLTITAETAALVGTFKRLKESMDKEVASGINFSVKDYFTYRLKYGLSEAEMAEVFQKNRMSALALGGKKQYEHYLDYAQESLETNILDFGDRTRYATDQMSILAKMGISPLITKSMHLSNTFLSDLQTLGILPDEFNKILEDMASSEEWLSELRVKQGKKLNYATIMEFTARLRLAKQMGMSVEQFTAREKSTSKFQEMPWVERYRAGAKLQAFAIAAGIPNATEIMRLSNLGERATGKDKMMWQQIGEDIRNYRNRVKGGNQPSEMLFDQLDAAYNIMQTFGPEYDTTLNKALEFRGNLKDKNRLGGEISPTTRKGMEIGQRIEGFVKSNGVISGLAGLGGLYSIKKLYDYYKLLKTAGTVAGVVEAGAAGAAGLGASTIAIGAGGIAALGAAGRWGYKEMGGMTEQEYANQNAEMFKWIPFINKENPTEFQKYYYPGIGWSNEDLREISPTMKQFREGGGYVPPTNIENQPQLNLNQPQEDFYKDQANISKTSQEVSNNTALSLDIQNRMNSTLERLVQNSDKQLTMMALTDAEKAKKSLSERLTSLKMNGDNYTYLSGLA